MALLRRCAILAALLSLLAGRVADACSCLNDFTNVKDAFKNSAFVFAGHVTKVDVVTLPRVFYSEAPNGWQAAQVMARRALVTIATTREWKGNGAPEYHVLAGAPADPPLKDGLILVDCDVHLELDTDVLVFATDGYSTAEPCSPTGLLSESQDVVVALDKLSAKKHPMRGPSRR